MGARSFFGARHACGVLPLAQRGAPAPVRVPMATAQPAPAGAVAWPWGQTTPATGAATAHTEAQTAATWPWGRAGAHRPVRMPGRTAERRS